MKLLLKQAAKDFNVTVTPDEIEASIEKEFGYDRNPPTPAPTRTPQPTPTASAPVTQTATPSPTPAPTATPISKESAQQFYQDYLRRPIACLIRTIANTRNCACSATRCATRWARPCRRRPSRSSFNTCASIRAAVPTVTEAIKAGRLCEGVSSGPVRTRCLTARSVLASEVTDWLPHEAFSNSTDLGQRSATHFSPRRLVRRRRIISNTTDTASFVGLITAKSLEPLSSTFLQQAQQNAVEAWLQQRRNPNFLLTWADRVPTKP